MIRNTNPSVVAARSIWKFAAWSVIGVVVQEILNLIPGFNLPPYVALIIAAAGKGFASYVETRKLEGK